MENICCNVRREARNSHKKMRNKREAITQHSEGSMDIILPDIKLRQ
jgi:hypothetical protein